MVGNGMIEPKLVLNGAGRIPKGQLRLTPDANMSGD
jgi:hypothetical protein